ncbi:hypothetical protein LINGRAPRIM_LOCUS2457, partial [Linum grandiflorum]
FHDSPPSSLSSSSSSSSLLLLLLLSRPPSPPRRRRRRRQPSPADLGSSFSPSGSRRRRRKRGSRRLFGSSLLSVGISATAMDARNPPLLRLLYSSRFAKDKDGSTLAGARLRRGRERRRTEDWYCVNGGGALIMVVTVVG